MIELHPKENVGLHGIANADCRDLSRHAVLIETTQSGDRGGLRTKTGKACTTATWT